MISCYIFTYCLHIYSLFLLCKCWTACSLEQKLPLNYCFISALKYYSNFVFHCLQLLMNGPTVIYSFPNVLGVGEGLLKCHFHQAVYYDFHSSTWCLWWHFYGVWLGTQTVWFVLYSLIRQFTRYWPLSTVSPKNLILMVNWMLLMDQNSDFGHASIAFQVFMEGQ